MGKKTVLIVEPSPILINLFKEEFKRFCDAFQIVTCDHICFKSPQEVKKYLKNPCEVVLLILSFKQDEDHHGLNFIEEFIQVHPETPVYIVSGNPPPNLKKPHLLSLPQVKHVKRPISISNVQSIYRDALLGI